MEKNSNNNLKISVSSGAFDRQSERSGIHDRKKFTKRIAEMNKHIEVLDRYDDFASLMLSASDFAKKGNQKYGIQRMNFHEGDNVILSHQQKATQNFLKELRGFGLLADVVGSGKTFEACSILSELSAKGKISSMLLIVPSQVYNTWIDVLENKFGLGEGVLKNVEQLAYENDLLERAEDGFWHAKRPIIVKAEDFAKWRESDVDGVLFDVVVVDEAHNLCAEEGEYAKSLKLLSVLMQTKKKARKTYCLLLSATPHSGNLASMFRLWYFIRCKGGNPADFDEGEDSERSETYIKEKNYYKEHICRGAETVMDFINKVRYSEVTDNFYQEFDEFIKKKNQEGFVQLLDAEKRFLIMEFLEENPTIKDKVSDNIAKAYHNGVLRSIMIRQPNDNIRKSKKIVNVMFFPLKKEAEKIKIKGVVNDNLYVDLNNLCAPNAVETADGSFYSLTEYVKRMGDKNNVNAGVANLLFNENGIFNQVGLSDEDFAKPNSRRYYWEILGRYSGSRKAKRVVDEKNTEIEYRAYYNKSELQFKYEVLKEILDKHDKERVIIFFDYDIKKSERLYDQVITALSDDEKYAKRVLVGGEGDKSIIEKEFNLKEDAVLVVTDSAFTEGANLQKSSVIVNFQVTPNPLAMEQRIGRIFRLGQERDVTVYSLADMRKLEGYVLSYFTYIGLMNSNSGDAAIIAGSNNDNMVTIRCEACGKVKLLAKEDYEAYLKKASEGSPDADRIFCNENERCRQFDVRGTLMTEINSSESKCDNCGSLIRRTNSEEGGGFYCMAFNNTGRGVMCNTGDNGDRELYCRKICSIAHCERFTSGALKGRCPALEYYKFNPNASEIDLISLCESCNYQSICPPKCRVGLGAEAVNGCSDCEYATCFPKPHTIKFDKKWEASCPICSARGVKGILHPVVARTFETYIRSAFDYVQDGGKAFCENLEKEAKKVSEIQEMLSNDKEMN